MRHKLLVTGGAGFIGSALMNKLVTSHNVVSVDNYSSGKESNHIEGCEYFNLDISSVEDFSFLGDLSFIFHLAASARISSSFKEPDRYFKSNVAGTYNICKFASSKKIPMVYAGSSSHHGGRFRNPYTFTKDLGEDIVRMHQECYQMRASIARFYNVYGSGESTDQNATLIGKWKGLLNSENKFVVYGDGSKRRDFTHVDDVVDGLFRIMNKSAYGHVFELGRGKNYSVMEVLEMFGQKHVNFEPDRPGEVDSTLCDNSLAKQILDWEPKNNLEDYIRDQISRSSSSISLSNVISQ
jgi:UDP-glucose 4-epimerase